MPFIMILVYVVAAVIVFGFLYWVVNNYVPEPMRRFAMLIMALIGVVFLLWFLFTIVGSMSTGSLPHIRSGLLVSNTYFA